MTPLTARSTRQNLTLLRRGICLISLFRFLAPGLALPAEKSQERALEKVRIAYSSVSGNQAPAWIAYEKGFFRQNGLDVELVFIESGSQAMGALLSGDVALAQVAGPSVIQNKLQGIDVVILAGFLNTMDYQLMVHQSITRPDQLKGKTLAVSRVGSSSDFATRYALDKYGLKPDKDVTIVEIGSQPARFAALEAGKIQGAMIAVPVTLRAKKLGFRALADLQMLGLEYQHTALVTTQALIRSNPDVVRRALRALVEAIHFYKTHRKESLAVLQKYLRGADADALAETYEGIGLALIPEKPYPTLRGIDVILNELAVKDPKARAARSDQFVDMSFIRELDKSGYIDRLYKSPAVAAPSASKPISALAKRAGTGEKISPKGAATPRADSTAAEPGAAVLPQQYKVRGGDTLSALAGKFYGLADKWPKIYKANAKTVRNPHFIYIGQELLIPADDRRGR